MGFRLCAVAVFLLCAACAPAPKPRPVRFDYPPTARPLFEVRYVSDAQAPIGKDDLDRARELLDRARKELQPEQWELLDRALATAEHAWSRYQAVRGQPATVPRAAPALGLIGGMRVAVTETAEASAVAPLLLLLGSLSPAPLGNGELPAWTEAELQFRTALQDAVKAAKKVSTQLEAAKARPAPNSLEERPPECRPIPIAPHAGGDKKHNDCADDVPPNRFREHDVMVAGVRFDALQVGKDVLWEIKTAQFDTYNPYVQERTIEKDVPQIKKERDAARACGYGFIVGVSSALHAEALQREVKGVTIVLTGCSR